MGDPSSSEANGIEISWATVSGTSIAELTNVFTLSNKIRHLLEEESKEQKQSLQQLENHDLLAEGTDLMREAAAEGYKTIGDLRELEEEDSERARRIADQSALRMRRRILEQEVDLLRDRYPELIWSSLIVHCFSVFEFNMRLIFRYLRLAGISSDTFSEIKENAFLDKVKVYVQRLSLADYDFGESDSWEMIQRHRSVRNLIVHHGSILDGSPTAEAVSDFLSAESPSIRKDTPIIEVSQDYIGEVIDDMQTWMLEIYDCLEETYDM